MTIVIEDAQMKSLAQKIAVVEGMTITDILRKSLILPARAVQAT